LTEKMVLSKSDRSKARGAVENPPHIYKQEEPLPSFLLLVCPQKSRRFDCYGSRARGT
jgi:hypothetical protein